MSTIDKILDFAELIAMEDEAKMKKLNDWEEYIKPLFKKHTGYEFNLGYVSMYGKEWTDWLDLKRYDFNNNYNR